MPRVWGPSGGGFPEVVRLPVELRAHLALVVGEIDDHALEAFCSDLALAIGIFRLHEQIHQSSSPKAVRNNLAALESALMKLAVAAKALDGNSLLLLSSAGLDVTSLRLKIRGSLRPLRKAQEWAKQYPPQGGRLPQPQRLEFAVAVARAFFTHLRRRPTSTRHGVFQQLLPLVFAFALKQKSPPYDLFDLGAKAVKQWRSEANSA